MKEELKFAVSYVAVMSNMKSEQCVVLLVLVFIVLLGNNKVRSAKILVTIRKDILYLSNSKNNRCLASYQQKETLGVLQCAA